MSLIENCQKVLTTRGTGFTIESILTPSNKTYNCKVRASCKNGHISEKNVSTIVVSGCLECKGAMTPTKYTRDSMSEALRVRRLWPIELGETSKEPAKLECMDCWHVFEVKSVSKTLTKTGCPKCAGNVRKNASELMVLCAKNGWCMNWAEYEDSSYVKSYMRGRCQTCGTKHSGTILKKYIEGFAKCSVCDPRIKGFDLNKPATLYYLRIVEDYKIYYKIGITNLSVKERFCNSDLEKITVLSELHCEEGWKAQQLEKYFLDTFSEYRYQGEPVLVSGGNTELFVKDVLELDNP